MHALSVRHDKDILPCFAVGTCRYKAGESDPTSGKLLLFWVHSNEHLITQLSPATSAEVHGCIFAFADIHDMIAVAVNSSVSTIKYHGRIIC